MRIAPAVATAEENLVVNSIAATKSFLRAQGTATAAASWARFTTIELDAEF